MINDFNDYRLWMCFLVDNIWQQIAPFFKRLGPETEFNDSELINMTLVGKCRRWADETKMLNQWKKHRDLFPVALSQSRFNQQRRRLIQAFNLILRAVLKSSN